MIRPTEKIVDAIVRLKNDSAFGIVMKWFHDSMRVEALQSTKMSVEPQRTWEQGKVQQLEQILETIRSADESLDKMQQGGE